MYGLYSYCTSTVITQTNTRTSTGTHMLRYSTVPVLYLNVRILVLYSLSRIAAGSSNSDSGITLI